MGENEQGGMLRNIVIIGLIAIISMAVVGVIVTASDSTTKTTSTTTTSVHNAIVPKAQGAEARVPLDAWIGLGDGTTGKNVSYFNSEPAFDSSDPSIQAGDHYAVSYDVIVTADPSDPAVNGVTLDDFMPDGYIDTHTMFYYYGLDSNNQSYSRVGGFNYDDVMVTVNGKVPEDKVVKGESVHDYSYHEYLDLIKSMYSTIDDFNKAMNDSLDEGETPYDFQTWDDLADYVEDLYLQLYPSGYFPDTHTYPDLKKGDVIHVFVEGVLDDEHLDRDYVLTDDDFTLDNLRDPSFKLYDFYIEPAGPYLFYTSRYPGYTFGSKPMGSVAKNQRIAIWH